MRSVDRDRGSSLSCWKKAATKSAFTPARPIRVETVTLLAICRLMITSSPAVIPTKRPKTRMFVRIFKIQASYQIEQGEQKDPNYVYEVPVEPKVMNGFAITIKIATLESLSQEIDDHDQTSHHVDPVDSGGNVIA